MLVVRLLRFYKTFQGTKADLTMCFKVLGLRRFLRRTSESRSEGRPDDMITLIIVTRHFAHCIWKLVKSLMMINRVTARISLSSMFKYFVLCPNNSHISSCMIGLGWLN